MTLIGVFYRSPRGCFVRVPDPKWDAVDWHVSQKQSSTLDVGDRVEIRTNDTAVADIVRVITLKVTGFKPEQAGGGCEALTRVYPGGFTVSVTDGNHGLPDDGGPWECGAYAPDGGELDYCGLTHDGDEGGVLNAIARMEYAIRVAQLEAAGATTSDAQGMTDVEQIEGTLSERVSKGE